MRICDCGSTVIRRKSPTEALAVYILGDAVEELESVRAPVVTPGALGASAVLVPTVVFDPHPKAKANRASVSI
jgi:hypothetical protein